MPNKAHPMTSSSCKTSSQGAGRQFHTLIGPGTEVTFPRARLEDPQSPKLAVTGVTVSAALVCRPLKQVAEDGDTQVSDKTSLAGGRRQPRPASMSRAA